jgi:aspartate aminotransferase
MHSHPLADVPQAPPDVMFGLSAAFRADNDPRKVDLGVGAYRHDNGKAWVLPAVRDVSIVVTSESSDIYR